VTARGAPLPPLQAILDVDAAAGAAWAPVDLARAFLDGGARFIQIRAKRLASGSFLDLADAVVALGRTAGARVIVNDRADIARLAGAAGVHVGQDDLPPAAARRLLGAEAIIGFSTHTEAQIDAAAAEPISYLAVGPVFGTRTKDTGYAAVGLPLVAAAARTSGARPVVAIGGITLENAPAVLAAGATSVAVIGDLLAGSRPDVRVREFLAALDRRPI
jgi:thiamine-phosphate pyrophosphorylase